MAVESITSQGIKLLSDLSLLEADETKSDGLGFQVYAKVLAGSIIGTPGPFTIGVFGEWGTGKTSLMRMIPDEVDGEDKYLGNFLFY